MLEKGEPAPDFTLPTTDGEVTLSDLNQQGKVILAFYSEDNTPLCSTEISMLADDWDVITDLRATVLAVSADSIDSHLEFAERVDAPFPLASDARLDAARLYGVADEDSKRCHRAVFVIDEKGQIIHAEPWFQPGNPTHYEAIFGALGFDV